MGRNTGDVDLGRFDLPAQFAAQNIDRNGLAHVRSRGQHRRRAEQPGHLLGHGVGAPHMARQHRNHELRCIIDHQHTRVFVLGFEVRRNQPHHRAQRDKENDLVKVGEQRGDFIAKSTAVGAYRVGQASHERREFLGHANAGLRHLARQSGGLLRTVFGDGNQDDAQGGIVVRQGVYGHAKFSSSISVLVFLRQPRCMSPRTRPGFLTSSSDR